MRKSIFRFGVTPSSRAATKRHDTHGFYHALESRMSADYAAGYTDAALGLGYQNAKQSPEYEDGYNAAKCDHAQ